MGVALVGAVQRSVVEAFDCSGHLDMDRLSGHYDYSRVNGAGKASTPGLSTVVVVVAIPLLGLCLPESSAAAGIIGHLASLDQSAQMVLLIWWL